MLERLYLPPSPSSSASLHSSLPRARAPCSVLHKDQSIKNAALHEINPVASSSTPRHHLFSSCRFSLPPPPPPPTTAVALFSPLLRLLPTTLDPWRTGGKEEEEEEEGRKGGMERHRRNYRGRDTIPLTWMGSLSASEGTSSNRLRRLFFTARGHDALLLLPLLENYSLHAGFVNSPLVVGHPPIRLLDHGTTSPLPPPLATEQFFVFARGVSHALCHSRR